MLDTGCCSIHESWANGDSVGNTTWNQQGTPRSDGETWAVLVAGEHWLISAGYHSKGAHCSINWVCQAYDNLVKWIPAERIIVIAQLREVGAWLDTACETGLPLFSANFDIEQSKARWKERRADLLADSKMLRENGGSDYDWTDVNPATVIHVLTGKRVVANQAIDDVQDQYPAEEVEIDTKGSSSGSILIADDEASVYPDLETGQDSKVIASGMDNKHNARRQEEKRRAGLNTSCFANYHSLSASRWGKYNLGGSGRVLPIRSNSDQSGIESKHPPIKTVLIGMYSHGWSHSTAKGQHADQLISAVNCDICSKPHINSRYGDIPTVPAHSHSSMDTREWFMHMPHKVPDSVSNDLYQGVAYEMHPKYNHLLYWQLLFKAYHDIHCTSKDPSIRIVCLYQFCGSGGATKFFHRPSYQNAYHLSHWPLYIMATAGELRTSLTGGLFHLWFSYLNQALERNPDDSSNDDDGTKSVLHAGSSLEDLFLAVCSQYWINNQHALILPQQTYTHLADCLMCSEFHGPNETKNLCSSCFAKFTAMDSDQRPNLNQLAAKRIQRANDSDLETNEGKDSKMIPSTPFSFWNADSKPSSSGSNIQETQVSGNNTDGNGIIKLEASNPLELHPSAKVDGWISQHYGENSDIEKAKLADLFL